MAEETPKTAPPVKRPSFGDATADVLAQVLPHFDRIRDAAETAARDAAYKYVQGGATDSNLLSTAQGLHARVELYNNVITRLLADPMLPASVLQ